MAGLLVAVVAGLVIWLLPSDPAPRIELVANVLAIAFVARAILDRFVLPGAFPLLMAIGLAEMIYRLPPLRELVLAQVEDVAQCRAEGTLTCYGPLFAVGAMALVGFVLWLLARRILIVVLSTLKEKNATYEEKKK